MLSALRRAAVAAIAALAASLITGCTYEPTYTYDPVSSTNASPTETGTPLEFGDYFELVWDGEAEVNGETLYLDPVPMFRIGKPNSAGGVSVYATVRPLQGGTVKYATFIVEPINAVGDPVQSEIGGKSVMRLNFTGPASNSDVGLPVWENVWYNATIDHVLVTGAEVEYMDGTVLNFDMSDDPIRGDFRCQWDSSHLLCRPY